MLATIDIVQIVNKIGHIWKSMRTEWAILKRKYANPVTH